MMQTPEKIRARPIERSVTGKATVFLDSGVVLAASLSATGASRQVFDFAVVNLWRLVVSPWVLREVRDNLANKPAEASGAWATLRGRVTVEGDELTFDWPLNFDVTKDKPVLITALACDDVLLTLDRRDFRSLIGQTVYGLRVLTPGEFLRAEREAG
jgi:predicted nucleic acid-binding protein